MLTNILKIKRNKKLLISALLLFISSFILTVVYANNDTIKNRWRAVWHGTQWISSGEIINGQKIAENFEWLYNNTIQKDDLPECSGIYKKLEIINGQFICKDITPKGCKLKYRIKTSTDESDWVETDWGASNNGDWVYGEPAFVKGNPATIQYEIAVMCDEYNYMEIMYRFRGNRGPYNPQDKKVVSRKNSWGYGGWTTYYPKSCHIKGGDGGCGTPMDIPNQSGNLSCDIKARYNGYVTYKPGAWRGPSDRLGTTYGSSSANTNCNGKGCSLEMAIKCQ